MSTTTAVASDGADAKISPPFLWVPTSYFAMGTVYIMVSTASNTMFVNLGLSNAEATAYSSLTGFAFTFKPLWAPLLELYKTKKFWVVLMQAVLSVVFLALALTIKLPAFVVPVVTLLMVAAFCGATQDIVTDGVYVTSLGPKQQAAYTGIQSMSWSIGPILANGLLVLLVGYLAGENGTVKPPTTAYASAWLTVFVLLAAVMVAVSLWHFTFLPQGEKSADAPKSFGDAMSTFVKVFVTFFQKKDVLLLIGFAFFYRFGLGLLDKITTPFLLGARDTGGLGLDNTTLGWMNGLIGTGAFIGGSMLGGWFVSSRGLKRSLLLLCLALNVPNATFLYLGWAQPQSLWIVGLVFFIEKLGWGFGAVGHMVYMMQQIAPGPYKTAHYAFATGLGLSLCMTLTGLVSGSLQEAVGYKMFFVIVLIGALPSFLFTVLAPFHHADTAGSK